MEVSQSDSFEPARGDASGSDGVADIAVWHFCLSSQLCPGASARLDALRR
jgi:hypothetical protein